QFSQALAIAPHDYSAWVAKAYSQLLSGRMKQGRRTTAKIPANADPQGFVTSLRFDIAMLSRQPRKALEISDNTGDWRPYQAIRADALALMGDKRAARAAYAKRCGILRKKLKKHAD